MKLRRRAQALPLMRRSSIAGACVAAAGLAGGCGGAAPRGADVAPESKRSSRLVDLSQQPPYVNGLEIDPADGSFLLTTNRGFFRISSDGKRVERAKATVTDPAGTSPVGTYLEISAAGEGELIGSGHPDDPGALPPYLGLIRSTDGGKRWRIVSRLGEADFHQIRRDHGRLYAYDAVLGALLLSEDDGQQWIERPTPRGLVLDFVVDPEDEDYLITSTADELSRTTDRGKRFRSLEPSDAARLEWPEPGALMRADRDGTFQVSKDRGRTWEERGSVGGEPYRIKALDADRAYVALSDGSIVETTDGGRMWKVLFKA